MLRCVEVRFVAVDVRLSFVIEHVTEFNCKFAVFGDGSPTALLVLLGGYRGDIGGYRGLLGAVEVLLRGC